MKVDYTAGATLTSNVVVGIVTTLVAAPAAWISSQAILQTVNLAGCTGIELQLQGNSGNPAVVSYGSPIGQVAANVLPTVAKQDFDLVNPWLVKMPAATPSFQFFINIYFPTGTPAGSLGSIHFGACGVWAEPALSV